MAAVQIARTSERTMSKTILIVEDSTSMRQVVSIALTRAGYEVLEAGDGVEGLTRLDGRKINLVISDVNMPRMDGITFVAELKKNSRYKFTPVIMLTTESTDDKKQAGKVAGAKAWITKPFSPPVLLDAVSKLILP
jgi:two-component system chemotaxis response regulator CheY